MAAEASADMLRCLHERRSFRLEAGAGAGKTHALIEALEWLVEHRSEELVRQRAQIACITYTNVAVDEIRDRIGARTAIWVSTIHSFLWHLAAPFQKALRGLLEADEKVQEKLGDAGPSLGNRRVTYTDVGRLRITDHEVSISHDHVISLAVSLLERDKFRRVWVSRFPILLLDEYQDTSKDLVDALRRHLLEEESRLQIGLFGDHWQRIYDKGCGAVDDDRFQFIPKGANFRSAKPVVGVLNGIRPELPQAVSRKMEDCGELTDVIVLHTNSWPGPRGKGPHKNALDPDTQDAAVECVKGYLVNRGWSIEAGSCGLLQLTNKAVARREGFSHLLDVFEWTEDLLKRQDAFVDLLASRVEPAAELLAAGRKTAALEAVGWSMDAVKKLEDKRRARAWLDRLEELRASGTIGQVVELLNEANALSPGADRSLRRARSEKEEGEDERVQQARDRWHALSEIAYEQFRRWYAYDRGTTMVSTKHGVKGAQFDEVVAVFGGGWSKYDFPRMLDEWSMQQNKDTPDAPFTNARNLYYVTLSRARYRLALVFLTTLPAGALEQLRGQFGEDNVIELPALK
jgi:DNA helicase-2/ATP-dependent DNA helicase PcrA